MAQILLTVGGTIILLMGIGHFVLTLRDVWRPTSFTPTDESVRLTMQGAQLRFSRRINLWDSWLGFNLSHSMGPIMFGAALLYAAQVHLAAFLESLFLQALAVLIPVVYLVVAIRFWFWGPVLGISIVLLCILGAVLL
jgi:hypothetical protein